MVAVNPLRISNNGTHTRMHYAVVVSLSTTLIASTRIRKDARYGLPGVTICTPRPLVIALIGAVIGSMATNSPGVLWRIDLRIAIAGEKFDYDFASGP